MNAPGTPQEPLMELEPEAAVRLAMVWHREGRLDAAEQIYRSLMKRKPVDANVLHFLGLLMHQRGRSDEACTLMMRSLAADPTVPDWHNNLGNVLLETGRVDEAATAYEEAARLAPDRADVQNNLGVLRREQRRLDESEAAYRRAIALDAQFVDAHTNLGNLLHSQRRDEEALHSYCEALALRPQNVRARQALGMAYYTLGRFEEATRVYADWLRDEPDSPEARHHLAACSGRDVPGRAADDYVEKVFDGFAGSFDAKLANLHYRAPHLLAQEVRDRLGEPRADRIVLDAGCGTGLCGPLLKPWARELLGVDLSAGMLARAEPRGVYDKLAKAELTAYIQALPAEGTDLIVSADTLCYFGDLSEVVQASAKALAPDGWLMFTVEALPQDAANPFHLNPHGRYSHRMDYVDGVLGAAGLRPHSLQQVHLRTEGGKPVAGYLVSACKSEPARSSS
ncbi:tetratricopeptide repeat protein [Variovorax dokdonensis]|uniref:Tetratricopeptide repeat protein n=1 Tax=Variovorax dokdonensis TaxID=344883 RepID=A0ABT7NAK0_9BURK|nr:tetratricopeptide repeat protein [Variovorax dokdonensis]MDM0044961.1 tetratricopeptide repeat protein [Variovorax dokdonensis]